MMGKTVVPLLEICCGDIASVIEAQRGGADRVEMCSALGEGGVTPSAGMMREARRVEGIKMNVLIRPRGGDFLYSEEEIRIMLADIAVARDAGADGVVIGALSPDGSIDMEACRRMIDVAQGMSVTFHRAFDMTADADKALEDVIRLGCDRILTSGLSRTAETGIPMLRHLVEKAQGRISIMPGSGVSKDNARRITDATGAREIHASARSEVASGMVYRNLSVSMGAAGADEYMRKQTDRDIVKAIKNTLL